MADQSNSLGRVSGRVVALLVADGVDAAQVGSICWALAARGARVERIAPLSGPVRPVGGAWFDSDRILENTPSLAYDAVVVPGGAPAACALASNVRALSFVAQAFHHHKTLAFIGEGIRLLQAGPRGLRRCPGLVVEPGDQASPSFLNELMTELGRHRHVHRHYFEAETA